MSRPNSLQAAYRGVQELAYPEKRQEADVEPYGDSAIGLKLLRKASSWRSSLHQRSARTPPVPQLHPASQQDLTDFDQFRNRTTFTSITFFTLASSGPIHERSRSRGLPSVSRISLTPSCRNKSGCFDRTLTVAKLRLRKCKWPKASGLDFREDSSTER